MKRVALSFLAGFLATLAFHQPLLWLFHRTPYNMKAVPPFCVPSVISLAFWGGVWGVIMIPLIARARGAAWWVAAIAFGAVFPTLVAFFIVAPLKGAHIAANPRMFAVGLALNGAWGLGTALFYRIFGGK